MDRQERIEENADRLSVRAAELHDILNTLNFHSPREAADDLRHSAGDLIRDMKKRVRFIHEALIGGMGIKNVPPAAEEELTAMNEYLDTLRSYSGDHAGYQRLLSILVPLLDLLKKWATAGPDVPRGD
ncbi:MAG: hypothetical protein ABIH66_07640 [bacterium]